MINSDISKATLPELLEHLGDIESSPMRIKNTYDNTRLIFEPTPTEVAHVSNIEVICSWAAAHGYSVSIQTNGADNNGIAVCLSRLYPATSGNK